MYTSKDQLQLFCIFMIAIVGIEAVFLAVKLRTDVEDIVQMVLILILFLCVCVGYQATEFRSRTRAKWFFQGMVLIEVLEVTELVVSIIRRWAFTQSSVPSRVDHLMISEIFNIVTSAVGIFLGYRFHKSLPAINTAGSYISPEVLEIQGDDVDTGPPDAKQTLLSQL